MILTRSLASKASTGLLCRSSGLAATTTTATAAATVATGIAATATWPAGVATTATASLAAALPLVLPLACEGIGADVAKRRFHRIRLAGASRFVCACVAAIPTLAAWRGGRYAGLAKARARACITSAWATPLCTGATPVVVTRITARLLTRLASWLARAGSVTAHVSARL